MKQCIKCDKNAIISHVIWRRDENNIHVTEPIEIWYDCPCNKKRLNKKLDDGDKNLLKKIEKEKIEYWYPDDRLIWNSRINVEKDTKISDLFSKRNLICLSILYNEIEKIKDKDIKNMMKFVFTSFIANSSRLNFKNVGGNQSKGHGWAIRGYWIPIEYFEQNVWSDFSRKFNYVVKGKKQANDECNNYKETNDFNKLKNNYNFFLSNTSVLDIDNILKPNSIDYIFTDPPYGDAVPYLELYFMWSKWLQFNPDFENEIIVSNSGFALKLRKIAYF